MLNGCLELVVFSERFRNVDLYQQGLYTVRYSIAQGSALARPVECLQTTYSDPLYRLKSPCCDLESNSVQSAVFLIRYAEEEAQIREFARFRLESRVSPWEEIVLTVELLYSDLDKDLTVDTIQKRLSDTGTVEFKSVSRLDLPLKGSKTGILEPMVLEFDDLHKCVILGSFLCVFSDYRFRSQVSNINSDLMYEFISKVMVVDRKGQPKLLLGADESDRLYEEIVRPQALSHELLRSYLCDVLNRYVPIPNKAQYSDLPLPLALPNYHKKDTVKATKFSLAVASHEATAICEGVMRDVTYIGVQIGKLMESLREVITAYPLHCMSPLFERRLERMRSWSAAFIKRHPHSVSKLPHTPDLPDPSDLRRQIARDQRSLSTTHLESPIERLPGETFTSPILFEDSYSSLNPVPPPLLLEPTEPRQGKKHLFVLVHGFHGKSLDLRLVKHAIMTYSTLATVLCASANETHAEIDVMEMGRNLAEEVRRYVLEWLPGDTLGRVSFVGYSLGGVIVRAALPLLMDYAPHFHAFISLSAPHLGHVVENSLVGAGLWLLERVKKTLLLQQLLLNDSEDLRETALYRLSHAPGLEHFRHLILCSSYQDKYVPHDSARMEVTSSLPIRPDKRQCCSEMAHNLLSRLTPDLFIRLDVDFPDPGLSLDTMTGRSAHLMFVTNPHFLRLLVYQYSEAFT